MIFFFVLLAFLPSFAWLLFFLREDNHPEPKRLLATLFIGGFIAAALALAAQIFLTQTMGLPELSQFSRLPTSFPLAVTAFLVAFIFGGTEEVGKFIPTYFLVRKNKSFDEPVDAMIYMTTAGLGFAFIENAAILAFSFEHALIGNTIGLLILRFVGATLLHALSSAVAGYFWARAMAHWQSRAGNGGAHPEFIQNHEPVHARIFIGGLLFASLLHGIFNYLIISSQELLIYPTVFLIITAFFVFWDFEKLKKPTPAETDDALPQKITI